MADIRAAAERRAYRKREEDTELIAPPEELQGALNVAAETRKSMSAIRAITERRACGAHSIPRSAPRSETIERRRKPVERVDDGMEGYKEESAEACILFPPGPQLEITPVMAAPHLAKTPHEVEPLKCGGAYRPNHVYSGRSGGAGGGLSETLGLRYGQPPPGR